ncbi:hypothetical protein FocTR4_00005043 [Fusarium oxysporum f. sp. cubense]|uniref:Uncharacterized protein n=1 Tax=Fusarium oxysporum f. sp. cubense TaxID=61366 RepID=A0A5C6TH06_FUSOC|nr:hypothetical protein FocTR4_00005043 [Fusarium oxysporum f. sp. cubense]
MAPSDTNNRATKPPASGSSSGDADLAQVSQLVETFSLRLAATSRTLLICICIHIGILHSASLIPGSWGWPTETLPEPQLTQRLHRGEQAATALENNLSNLESRLDAILAALEARETPQMPATAAKVNSSPGAADKDQKGRSLDGANGDAEKIEKDAT